MGQYFWFFNNTLGKQRSKVPIISNFGLPWAKGLDRYPEENYQVFRQVIDDNKWSEDHEIIAVGEYGDRIRWQDVRNGVSEGDEKTEEAPQEVEVEAETDDGKEVLDRAFLQALESEGEEEAGGEGEVEEEEESEYDISFSLTDLRDLLAAKGITTNLDPQVEEEE